MIPQRNLSLQMAHLPEFDEVFRAALRELRQAGFLSDMNS
jgi:hypothetical protein